MCFFGIRRASVTCLTGCAHLLQIPGWENLSTPKLHLLFPHLKPLPANLPFRSWIFLPIPEKSSRDSLPPQSGLLDDLPNPPQSCLHIPASVKEGDSIQV